MPAWTGSLLARPKWTKYIPHRPTPRQRVFLMLPDCYVEGFYGGAAGGGKSDALLMAALQYVDVPGYAALLLRRTYKDLSLPNALMDRANQWLRRWPDEVKWSDQTKTWTFPTGATLTFGYLDHDNHVYQYQGAELQFVGFDELTQFSEFQYRYLFSRLRRLKTATVPIRMRSASNPGGIGHEWVKERFILNRAPDRIFIPASIADNPYLDAEEYAKSLGLLDDVTRAQLLAGDWDVAREGTLAKREWFQIVPDVPKDARRVRAWDFAATERSTASQDPDYTVGARLAERDGIYYIEHVIRQRVGPGDVEALVCQTAATDGYGIPIVMEQEPGSSGKLFTSNMIRRLSGFTVKAEKATGDKVQRAMPFLSQAQAGNVKLVRGGWCSDLLDELAAFPVGSHDDQVDATALAFNALARPAPQPSRFY